MRDSPGFELVPQLAPLASEAIFDKIMMSALEGTPLAIALRDCGIRALAIVGISALARRALRVADGTCRHPARAQRRRQAVLSRAMPASRAGARVDAAGIRV